MINYKNRRFVSALIIAILIHIIMGSILYVNFRPATKPETTGAKEQAETQTQSKSTDIPADYEDFVLTSDKPGTGKIIGDAEEKISDSNIHTVKRGEGYWLIARKYQLSVEDLLTYNRLSTKHVLKVGDKLKIPKK